MIWQYSRRKKQPRQGQRSQQAGLGLGLPDTAVPGTASYQEPHGPADALHAVGRPWLFLPFATQSPTRWRTDAALGSTPRVLMDYAGATPFSYDCHLPPCPSASKYDIGKTIPFQENATSYSIVYSGVIMVRPPTASACRLYAIYDGVIVAHAVAYHQLHLRHHACSPPTATGPVERPGSPGNGFRDLEPKDIIRRHEQHLGRQ